MPPPPHGPAPPLEARRTGLLGLLAASFLLLSGCSEQSTSASRAPIIDGRPAELEELPAVVGLRRGGSGFCTGTLVHPRAVLTAAHCATTDGVEVVAGVESENEDAPATAVAARLVHPGFRYFPLTDDVAVLVLAEPLGVEPALFGPAPVVGDEVRIAGFGVSSEARDSGVLHVGTAQVAETDELRFRVTAGPSLACGGDSGGPVFDADGLLVGVISSGDADCAERTSASRVDAFLPLIDEALLAVDAEVAAGARCLHDDGCPAESSCESRGPRGGVCDAACDDASDCPAGMRCGSGRCELLDDGPGKLGTACDGWLSCVEGSCLDESGAPVFDGGGHCSLGCTSATDVRCDRLNGVCVPDEASGVLLCLPAESGGGCSAATGSGSRTGFGIALLALALAHRRRRP